jgi:hypothetical protein
VEVWAVRTAEGEHDTATDVIVGFDGGVVPLLPLPPPQPIEMNVAKTARPASQYLRSRRVALVADSIDVQPVRGRKDLHSEEVVSLDNPECVQLPGRRSISGCEGSRGKESVFALFQIAGGCLIGVVSGVLEVQGDSLLVDAS